MNRRKLLLGALGATMALPFLETFAPRRARAGGTDAETFAIFCRQGNGVQQETDDEPERFWPSFGPGPLTQEKMLADTGRAVSELGDFADRLLLLHGIRYGFASSGCPHAAGGNQCLTGAKVSVAPKADATLAMSLAMGESIDFRIQRELGEKGVEPLALYVGWKDGYLDEVLSYRGPMQLRGAENNPLNVYRGLFGLAGADPAMLEILRKRRTSVNDLVREQMQALLARKDLSMADRQRLDLHFSSIRDVELGLSCSPPDGLGASVAQIAPSATENDRFEEVCKLQMDLLTLAVSCGAVRSATLQLGTGNAKMEFVIFGAKQKQYHKISHRIDSNGDDGAAITGADVLHHEIDRIHARLFRHLLARLDAVKLASGSLLDAGVAVWLNDLGDKHHSFERVPYILAGGCKGALATGQYLRLGGVTNNRLLSTIGAAVGCKNGAGEPLDDFGDESLPKGLLTEILA